MEQNRIELLNGDRYAVIKEAGFTAVTGNSRDFTTPLSKNKIVDSFKGPSVSAAIGWNKRPDCTNWSYVADFRSAVCSAAAPPERAAALT